MKRTLKILTLLIFSQSFGQIQNDSIPTESKFIAYYLISNSCDSITDWYEKKTCSKKEIESRFRKEIFKSDLIENLPIKEYLIWHTFIIDQNGLISDVNIKTDNSKLKAELKRILEENISDFRLIDENGIIKKGRFSFPIEIKILE
jgi:hypothetical protein